MASINANHNPPLSPRKTPFRRKVAEDSLPIIRSKSLDYSGSEKRSLDYSSDKTSSSSNDHYEDIASAATSLNSSFDAALGEESTTIFRSQPRIVETAASWDATGGGEHFLVGRKHLSSDLEDNQSPPSTVRKIPRRTSYDAAFTDSTPCRPLPTTTRPFRLPQPTPGSSSRRRKAAPLENHKVKSPYPQQRNSSNPDPMYGELSPHATPLFLPQLYQNNTTSKNNTCNTASTLDLTGDSQVESPVSTPFRFTSFPASLPRVNNPRFPLSDTPAAAACPQTTRKKMNFSSALGASNDPQASVWKRARPALPQDETAQTSSLSSMSSDQLNNSTTCFVPPSTLELTTGEGGAVVRRIDTNFSDDSDAPEPRQVMPSSGVNLFIQDYSYDEEEESPTTNRLDVSRTRLDFNVAADDDPKTGEGMTTDNKAVDDDDDDDKSCTTKPVHRTLEYPDMEETFPATSAMMTDERRDACPSSPEAQFLSRLDAAQCSPILPYHNDDDNCKDLVVMEDSTPPRVDQRLLSPVDESRLSTSHHSGESSSSSSKQRRLRPMPDMSAFDGSATASADAGKEEDLPKLTCPPTPVRTPAWAHNNNHNPSSSTEKKKKPLLRCNSLIVTKVLATCPLQAAMETTTSFEDSNSALDTTDEIEKRKISLSFSTVEEDDDEEMMIQGESSDGPQESSSFPLQQEEASKDVIVSFTKDFENLGPLGKGSFADVYKVRSKLDDCLYAVKRNRRQFRGKRDRDMALAEVRVMQQISGSPYILSFVRAWQEEGYLYCQTALCCRDTCRELMESLRTHWSQSVQRYPSLQKHFASGQASQPTPESTIWKICHDVLAGLTHIHSHNIVHYDIKPDNIFFVSHPRVICKIGDFGLAGDLNSPAGEEGDTVYMPPELLTSPKRQFSADLFSLGLTLYELASPVGWEIPSEGPRWHALRDGKHIPELAITTNGQRKHSLQKLIQRCIGDKENRPTAQSIFTQYFSSPVDEDEFLRDYLRDIDAFDSQQQRTNNHPNNTNQTPRTNSARDLKTPSPAGLLFSTH
mmetsp:Transcript_29003/g.43819  ORF Transcript_29003/g.43819 Transcript_29003/m.43819 type:complete len:1038 (-) Transcript_29003:178-3291(-)